MEICMRFLLDKWGQNYLSLVYHFLKLPLRYLLYQMHIHNTSNISNEAFRKKAISLLLLCYCVIFNAAQKFLEMTAKYNFRDKDK